MARLLESIFLEGPTGRLEALHENPDETVRAERAVVICHPHPLHGGPCTTRLSTGWPRGRDARTRRCCASISGGSSKARGSTTKASASKTICARLWTTFARRYPGLPLAVAGFSFGSRVGLAVSCGDTRIERCLAVGTPVDHGGWDFLTHCGCPTFFLHSTNDEHGSRHTMEQVFARAAAPKTLAWIEASDHFFDGGLDELEEATYRAVAADIPPVV